MSTRERWIVYPILFMTLGIALRDKLVPADLRPMSVNCPQIRCGQIEADRVVCGGVTVTDAQNRPLARLGANQAGGLLTLIDPERQIEVALGHDGQGLILSGYFTDLKRETTLSLPCQWRDVRRKMALENNLTPR